MGNEIVLENQLQGIAGTVWDLIGAGSPNIEGFTTDISTDQGHTVEFKIDTDSTNYRIEIYRLGYYGGAGARLVTTLQHAGPAVSQPAPLSDPATGLVDAGNWQVTDAWKVPADAASGIYLARLVRQDGTSGSNIIPFVVRDDDGQSDIILQTDDSTWQAYNTWGGASLYGDSNGTAVANAVGYNRPMNTEWLTLYLDQTLPAVMWLEKNGYDVSHMTNVDTARNGALLLDHKVFLSVGHDEYWSAEQYNNVMAARDAGVNLQFWTGNDIYWKTQWKPSIDGSGTDYRTVVTYKETERGSINPDGVWTGTWSDPNATEALVLPNALKGNIFGVLQTEPYLSNITIPYAQSQLRFWRDTSIANTQLGDTATLATYLGPEWNYDLDNGFRPAGLINLSTTTVSTVRQLYNYTTVLGQPGTATHNLTLYRADSGALVFGAGSIFWSWALDDHHYPLANQDPAPDPNVQQAMVNLFADMGVQPKTLQADLVYATASSDFEAPIVRLGELYMSLVGSDMTATVAGTASDLSGGQVAGIEVTTDGGAWWHPAGGTTSWSYTSTGPAPTTVLARAVDDSLNLGQAQALPTSVLTRAVTDTQGTGAAQALALHDTADNQPWTVVWNNYDGFGNWDQQSITFDDGTAAIALLDPFNSQPWSVVWNSYDTFGNWDQQGITFDEGTMAVASLDPLNIHAWSAVWDEYDDLGNWVTQSVELDDDTSSIAYLNPLASDPWSMVYYNYDDLGNWVSQDIEFKDGTSAVSYLDPLGSQPWSLVWNYYDDLGNWTSQNIQFDDGTSSVAILDPLNSQPWSLVWDNYNTAGAWISQNIQYDDGSTRYSDIDWANTNDWFSDNYTYDSRNTLTSHYQVMDDKSLVYLFPSQPA